MGFKPEHIIEFKLGDISSIRAALEIYQGLLKEDKVNRDNQMNVLFTYIENGMQKPLQSCNGDENELKKLDKVTHNQYLNIVHTFSRVSSEGIFFSHALTFDELKQDVITTATEIVNYSRRHNDTWEMWADDMCVFGLDPVFLLGQKYPEYTYLLGAFIIPYWDNEHADYAFLYLKYNYLQKGFDTNVMKAYCYCDNGEGRNYLVNIYDDYADEGEKFNLVDYFRNNNDKYLLFKNMLKERFIKQEFIQYSEQDYTKNPIEEIFETMIETFENISMEDVFIDDTFDNEAYKIKMEIEEYIGKPLTLEPKDEDEDENWENNNYTVWKDLFINCFENGENVWQYVLTGENENVVEQIKYVEIEKICREKNLKMCERLDFYLGEFETFENQFYSLFDIFIETFYEESDHGFIETINGVDQTGRDVVKRALDILFRAMDRKIFCDETYESILQYKIMDEAEFYNRYDAKCKNIVSAISFLLSEYIVYDFERKDSSRKYNIINANRELVLELFKGDAYKSLNKGELQITNDIVLQEEQFEIVKDGLTVNPSNLSIAAIILYFDCNNRVADDLTKYLIEFIKKNWVNVFTDEIRKNGEFTDDELETLKKYLIGPVIKIQESALANIQALMNSKKDVVEIGTILDILKKKLYSDVSTSDPQIQYNVLSSMEEALHNLIPMIYIVSFGFPSLMSNPAKNALKLLTHLAPIKTIKEVEKIVTALRRESDMYVVKRDMSKMVEDEKFLLAAEIFIANKNDDINKFVQMFIDDEESSSMLFKSIGRATIQEALNQLDKYFKSRFYDKVDEIDEDILKEYLEKEMFDGIRGLVAGCLCRVDRENQELVNTLTNETTAYIKGEISLENMMNFKSHVTEMHIERELLAVIWKLDTVYISRIIMLCSQYGVGGLNSVSPRSGSIETYINMLLELEIDKQLIVNLIIEIRDEEALEYIEDEIEIYDYIKHLPLKEREVAVELTTVLAVDQECYIDFIIQMTADSSQKIKGLSKKALQQIDSDVLEEDCYQNQFKKVSNEGDENTKNICKGFII